MTRTLAALALSLSGALAGCTAPAQDDRTPRIEIVDQLPEGGEIHQFTREAGTGLQPQQAEVCSCSLQSACVCTAEGGACGEDCCWQTLEVTCK